MQDPKSPLEFYLTSYALEAGYRPQCLTKLAAILVIHTEKGVLFKEPYHALSNAIEKIGYMFLAGDKIREIESKRQEFRRFHVFVTYHVWSFVVACKACLDAISGLLNREYTLGFKTGKIDLKHDHFFNKLSRENKKLGKRISKYHKWIKNISEIRDNFIHRQSLVAVPSGDNDRTAYQKGKIILRLPDGSIVDWWEFYRHNIANITKLFEITCDNLIERKLPMK